jgi:hypothetical protein
VRGDRALAHVGVVEANDSHVHAAQARHHRYTANWCITLQQNPLVLPMPTRGDPL